MVSKDEENRLERTETLPNGVTFKVREHSRITPDERHAIIDLCARALDGDFGKYWEYMSNAVHVLLFKGSRLVATAFWWERTLYHDPAFPLRTAYVEGVAVEPTLQGKGYGAALMAVVAQQTWDYDLLALDTEIPDFYRRCGWESWLGPTWVLRSEGMLDQPVEGIMIRRTERTPAWLDVNGALWKDGYLAPASLEAAKAGSTAFFPPLYPFPKPERKRSPR